MPLSDENRKLVERVAPLAAHLYEVDTESRTLGWSQEDLNRLLDAARAVGPPIEAKAHAPLSDENRALIKKAGHFDTLRSPDYWVPAYILQDIMEAARAEGAAMLEEVAEHLASVTGADDRPGSDSAELVERARAIYRKGQ